MVQKYNEIKENQETTIFQWMDKSTESWFDVAIYPSDEGMIIHWHDISERKRAQEKLSSILENIDRGFMSLDRNWRFVYINSKAAANVGRTPNELIGKYLWSEFPQIEGTNAAKCYRKAMDDRVAVEFEEQGVITNRCYEEKVYPTSDGIAIYWANVTERKKAEDAQRYDNRKFELLTSITSRLLSSAIPQQIVQQISEQVMAFLGCDVFFNFLVDEEEEKLHLNAYAGVPPETAKTFVA